MIGKKPVCVLGVALALTIAVVWNLTAGAPAHQQQRDTMTKLFQAGNFKDAYEGLRKLALDAASGAVRWQTTSKPTPYLRPCKAI